MKNLKILSGKISDHAGGFESFQDISVLWKKQNNEKLTSESVGFQRDFGEFTLIQFCVQTMQSPGGFVKQSKTLFFFENWSISKIQEDYRPISKLIFWRKQWNRSLFWPTEKKSQVKETETTKKERTECFSKHWKVGVQATKTVAILVSRAVSRWRNSVVETWFSKMIFCSSGRTSVFSWQDEVKKESKRSQIVSKTLLSEISL